MKELKIQVPKGYEIDKEKSTFEKIVFKEIEKQLPKKWEEIGIINGYYITEFSNIIDIEELEPHENNKNVFRTKEQAEAAIALAKLSQLMYVYNDGWEPDWDNELEIKHIIYFYKNNIEADYVYITKYFLSFKTEQIRDKFLENFKDLIEQAKPLL